MKTLDIALGARSYQVCIGRGLLGERAQVVPWVKGGQVCIVTDSAVAPLYLEGVRGQLVAAGKEVVVHVLPSGEASKNLQELEGIFAAMLGVPCDRETTVIALGGGVVGDMAGFAAACYQRGVAFLQLPTTLLAQVDSAVGGKTAVNHALGKNMIGAFYQPRRVVADTATLDSLPRRELCAGLAEVIKYGLINDGEFFAYLEENIGAALAREAGVLEFIIARSCRNKADIVEGDEREAVTGNGGGGGRALLNLGHTFAHAIETGAGYGEWLHGEAVAMGMAMAADMSVRLGWLGEAERARVVGVLQAAELPVAPSNALPLKLTAGDMLELMRADKKVRAGKIRLILLRGIGKAEMVSEYPMEALQETLAEFAGGAG